MTMFNAVTVNVPQESVTPDSGVTGGTTDESDFFMLDAAPMTTNRQLPTDLLVKFVAESEEHLARVEETLVGMDTGGVSDEQLGEAFRAMHSFKGNSGICGFADMERLTHSAETLMGAFRDKKRQPNPHVVSLLLEVVDVLRVALTTIPGGDGRIPTLAILLQRLDSLEQVDADESWPSPPEANVATGGAGQALGYAKPESNTGSKGGSSIRVDTAKLDDLMNLVGELIIAETTVTKNPDLDGYDFENFQKAALNLNRLTRALQDLAMAVRMVPIASTLRKMTRLVRDVSAKQKKRIELIITGEETEVDKTIVESIADPLVHLIRNSLDHGIETAEERRLASKAPVGKVWLDAKHQGGEVWLTIRDDGRGLDPAKLLAKAIQRGIADASRQYTDRETFEFIFAPGFSTATQITDISGRGVGMDVVRRNLEAVKGRVEVASELGKGTTFTLRIPLTLAIVEGMLVRIANAHYTIPLLAIRESVKAQPSDITRLCDGRELLKLRQRHYPIVKLGDAYRGRNTGLSALDGILVVVESGEQLACVLVDEVIGQRQTVIKPLPAYLRTTRGLAGCSILPNGEISLILDVDSVVEGRKARNVMEQQ